MNVTDILARRRDLLAAKASIEANRPRPRRPYETVMGPFPEYADGPAWEAIGALVAPDLVAISGGRTTASLGMLAQGDAGPAPKPGVYRKGSASKGAKFVRAVMPAEEVEARDAFTAFLEHEKASEAFSTDSHRAFELDQQADSLAADALMAWYRQEADALAREFVAEAKEQVLAFRAKYGTKPSWLDRCYFQDGYNSGHPQSSFLHRKVEERFGQEPELYKFRGYKCIGDRDPRGDFSQRVAPLAKQACDELGLE